MINWERLLMAAVCSATLIGGCIVLVLLPDHVFLALIKVAFVCMLIFLFYKALEDNSQNNKENGTDKD